MKKLFSILFFLCVSTIAIFAQFINLDTEQIQKVTATSLILRDKPSKTGAKVAAIPQNTMIFTISTPADESEVIEGKKGYWIQTYYQGQHGYIFSAYLSEDVDFDKSRSVLQDIYVVSNTEGNAKSLMDKPQLQGAMELLSLEEGASVYVIEGKKLLKVLEADDSDWIKVRYKDTVGYMRSDFLMNYELYGLYLESRE